MEKLNFFRKNIKWPNSSNNRRCPPKVFPGKGVLKICSKFTGELPCRSVISIKFICKATLLKSDFSMGVLL